MNFNPRNFRIFYGENDKEKDGMIAKVFPQRNNTTGETYMRIHYYKLANKMEFIHELGHPYFRLQLGIDPFFIPPEKSNPNIKYIVNAIEDAFVNYRLCKFDEFYQLLVKDFERVLTYVFTEGIYRMGECYTHSFFLTVLYTYILKIQEQKRLERNYNIFLNEPFRTCKFVLSLKVLTEIKDFGLAKFKRLKDSNDKDLYYQFVYELIQKCGFYSDEDIKKNLYLLYGIDK